MALTHPPQYRTGRDCNGVVRRLPLRLHDIEPGTAFIFEGRSYIKLGWFERGQFINGTWYRRHGVRRSDGHEGWLIGFVKVRVLKARKP
jgi:hypothetical protein